MVGVVVWVTLGVFVGWMASLLLKTDEADRSTVANILASVVGAVMGGFVARLLGYSGARIEQVLTFQSVLFSGVGAAILLLAVNFLAARRDTAHKQPHG